MKIIAHRANINGPDKSKENHPDQIEYALSCGFDCEIDLWYINNQLYLGHDYPQYKIELDFLLKNSDKLWCHCKDMDSLSLILKYPRLNCFYHQDDNYTLTSQNFIWVYPGVKVPNGGVVVMPELYPRLKYNNEFIYGICTDYPLSVDSFLESKV
jgi:hypothetical protein